VLVVTGDVDFDPVVKLAERWFGPIPNRNVQPRNIPKEPGQTEIREQTVIRDVPNDAIYMAYHMTDRLDPMYYATDLVSDVLSNGNSSRMYQNLVQKEKLFTELMHIFQEIMNLDYLWFQENQAMAFRSKLPEKRLSANSTG